MARLCEEGKPRYVHRLTLPFHCSHSLHCSSALHNSLTTVKMFSFSVNKAYKVWNKAAARLTVCARCLRRELLRMRFNAHRRRREYKRPEFRAASAHIRIASSRKAIVTRTTWIGWVGPVRTRTEFLWRQATPLFFYSPTPKPACNFLKLARENVCTHLN